MRTQNRLEGKFLAESTEAFSLLEVIGVIAILGIISAIGMVAVNSTTNKASELGQQRNLAELNRALASYQQMGGSLKGVKDPFSAIAKAKTIRKRDTAKNFVGFTGSPLDPQVSLRPLEKGNEGIYWDENAGRFLHGKAEKVYEVFVDRSAPVEAPVEEIRENSSVSYADKGWVWTYKEAPVGSRPPVTDIPVGPPAASSPPSAVADFFSIREGGVAQGNVLTNDSDPDGETLAVVSNEDAQKGVVSIRRNGALKYEPKQGAIGIDSFRYTIADQRGLESVNFVKIEIIPNNPPIAVDDRFEAEGQTPVTGNVLTNDSDYDNDPISVVNSTEPANGTVTVQPDGNFTYRAEAGFSGTDTFQYTIRDSFGKGSSASVFIDVEAHLAAVNDNKSGCSHRPMRIRPLDNDSGQNLEIVALNGQEVSSGSELVLASGAALVVGASGYIDFEPRGNHLLDPGVDETVTFSYSVTDGEDVATAQVTLTLQGPSKAVFTEDFGSGRRSDIGGAQHGGSTTCNYENGSGNQGPTDWLDANEYAVMDPAETIHSFFQNLTEDSTPGDSRGRALLVNSHSEPKTFYRTSIRNLEVGASYGFRANIASLLPATASQKDLPDVAFAIFDGGALVQMVNTGSIPHGTGWTAHEMDFVAPSRNLEIVLINYTNGTDGNDLGIDDIKVFQYGCQ